MKLLLKEKDVEGHNATEDSEDNVQRDKLMRVFLCDGVEEKDEDQDETQMHGIPINPRHDTEAIHPDVEQRHGNSDGKDSCMTSSRQRSDYRFNLFDLFANALAGSLKFYKVLRWRFSLIHVSTLWPR